MSTPHALIVDDNANGAEVLAGLLAEQGISNTIVLDSTRASAELRKLPKVDVIFLDLEMPKLNGFQLLPILRQQLVEAVPIITYTVHTSEMDAARKLGFDGFLGKPLDADRFPALIKRILDGKPVWELP
jgi:two-component system cell cycle response regulator DivK